MTSQRGTSNGMSPSAFLTALWGDVPAGRVQLWRLSDRKAFYPLTPAAADYYAGAEDVYTCVALTWPTRTTNAKGRPCAKDATAIAGLWLDIDVNGGPDDKTGAAPTHSAAENLAREVAEPTILVDSGYGLHAWWLLDDVWRFRTREDQQDATLLAAQWQELHRRRAGFHVDATHDLARLMRLPGTINAKDGGTAPVDVVDVTDARYTLDELRRLAATVGELPGMPAADEAASPVHVAAPSGVDATTIDVLLDDPDFRAAWTHQGGGDHHWSMSEWDLSIASRLAHAGGWTDQQIADVIAAHRRSRNPADPKAERVGYLRRTVMKARASAQRQTAADALRDLAARGRAA